MSDAQSELFPTTGRRPSWQGGRLPDPTVNHPGAVHRDATDTERKAAEMVTPRVGTLKAGILAYLRSEGGATMYELAEHLGALLYSVGPRLTELRVTGWIEDSTDRRKTPSGAQAIVWVLTQAGRSELGL